MNDLPQQPFHCLPTHRSASAGARPGFRSDKLLKLFLLAVFCGSFSAAASAGEPAEIFVKRLRAVGYYDTALQYLDRLDQYPGVPADFLDAVELERAQTLLEAAGATRNPAQRDEHLVAAEQALQDFLKDKPSHSRASEARLQLATLQMVRGAVLVKSSKPGDPNLEKARESYLAAAATFDELIDNLRGELEEMKGQRINAAEQPELADLRKRYYAQYVRSKRLSAEARRGAADTYENPVQNGRKLLEEALERFTELSDTHDDKVDGVVGMLQRGQVQEQLGQTKAAVDSYQRVLEVEDDVLRQPALEAVTGLVRLWLAEDPPKIQAAIDRAQPWVDGARPNEQRSKELQQLRLQLARAHLALKEKIESENGKATERRKADNSARQLLVATSRVPGTHQAEAKQLLAELGVDATEEPVDIEKPKSLDEAITAGRAQIEKFDQLNLSLELLRDQLQAEGTDKQTLNEEIDIIRGEQAEAMQKGIEILKHGMAFVKLGTDPTQVNEARQFLAYALYRDGRFSEAAVVGGFMARTSPGSQAGMQGGLLAINALQTKLQEDPKEASLLRQIESLGTYLVSQWPDEPQIARTRGTLVRIALTENRWEDARAQIEGTPDDSPEKAEFQRLMGQLVWNRFLTLKNEDPDSEEADALLPKAAGDLTAGLQSLETNSLTPVDLQAAMILAKVQLRQGNAEQALKTLENPKYGPLRHVGNVGSPSNDFEASLYGVALQAVVAQMTMPGSDSQALLKRSSDLMEKLRESVGEGADANDRLVRMYKSLAANIRSQLDDAPPGKKSDLIQAFELFLSRVADQTKDPATLQMVGQTLAEMGQAAMDDPDAQARGEAAELLQSAANTLANLIKLGGEEDKLLTIRFQLGRAYRLLGEYKKAIDEFEKVLIAKPMMLEVQVEAATAYEQWASNLNNPRFAGKAYESALRGTRPHPQTGKNTIWGWGRISQLTSGKAQFHDTFFNARYHVALCRFLQGKANDSKATMEQAIRDVTQLAATYPDMGGPQQQQKFDRLLRVIQKELQVPVTGLKNE